MDPAIMIPIMNYLFCHLHGSYIMQEEICRAAIPFPYYEL